MLTYVLAALLVVLRYKLLASEGGPEWLTLNTLTLGSITIAVGALFAVALMTLLSNFVASFTVRMLTLAVMTISVMAFDLTQLPDRESAPSWHAYHLCSRRS